MEPAAPLPHDDSQSFVVTCTERPEKFNSTTHLSLKSPEVKPARLASIISAFPSSEQAFCPTAELIENGIAELDEAPISTMPFFLRYSAGD